MTDLSQFRRNKDIQFQRDPYSPIPAEDRETFSGLNYFPESEALRFRLEIELFEHQEEITMQTSTGHRATYRRYGQITFPVNGTTQTLTVFQGIDQPHLFLPFKDATSAKETYGAGRYLELEPLGRDKYAVDFNMAYNPYCAYSNQWSCPVPPLENTLSAPIEAGEKSYK